MRFKNGIDNWNQARIENRGLTYMTGGYGFLISRIEFEIWWAILIANNTLIKDAALHCYLYLEGDQLQFLLIDSDSDKNEDYRLDQTIFIKDYNTHPLMESFATTMVPKITFQDDMYLKRMMRWLYFSHIWYRNKLNELTYQNAVDDKGPVRAFYIPFEDLIKAFDTTASPFVDQVALFFALKDFTENNVPYTDIELILCSIAEISDQAHECTLFADLTSPCPPFCGTGKYFNLLK